MARASAERDQEAATSPGLGLAVWLAIAILLLIVILGNIDRTILVLMVDPIKHDLGITDVQFSLLQGFAFVLFYAVAAVPMGWLADRTSRHWVLFFGVALWSVATVACGFTHSFRQLFIARIMVGMGEATLAPCAYAIIGELVPRRWMAMAVGILAAGSAFGTAIAYAGGGAVVQWALTAHAVAGVSTWHLVFLLVGAPGLLVAPMVFLIGGRRSRYAQLEANNAPTEGQKSYLHWLGQNGVYLGSLFLGIGFNAAVAYGVTAWAPAYFGRHFGMGPAAIGAAFGGIIAVSGLIGFVGGGWLVDRLNAKSVRNIHFRYFVFNSAAATLIGLAAFTLVSSVPLLLALMALLNILFPFTGPAIAHLRTRTPPQFRARTVALLNLVMNLVGMSVGPTSVAFFSDRLFGGPTHIGAGIAMLFLVYGPLTCACFAVGLRYGHLGSETDEPALLAAQTQAI